jgi:hypothetical protein
MEKRIFQRIFKNGVQNEIFLLFNFTSPFGLLHEEICRMVFFFFLTSYSFESDRVTPLFRVENRKICRPVFKNLQKNSYSIFCFTIIYIRLNTNNQIKKLDINFNIKQLPKNTINPKLEEKKFHWKQWGNPVCNKLPYEPQRNEHLYS